MTILLDGQNTQLANSDFPMLISAKEGLGASHFTICLMLDLFRQGRKILLFSAFPAAKADFKNMLTPQELDEVESVDHSESIVGKRAILINSGEEAEMIKILASMKDKNERIILIKNIEQYSHALFNTAMELQTVILSGDIDKINSIEWLRQRDFATKIFFSKPESLSIADFPALEKYQGVAFGKRHNGFVKLDK